MEKEKLINAIDFTIDSLKMHLNRIKNDDYKMHKVDVDLLIEKTRQLYGKLINLDGLTGSVEMEIVKEVDQQVKVITTEKELKEEPLTVNEMPEGMIDPEEREVETIMDITEVGVPAEEKTQQAEPEENKVVEKSEEDLSEKKEVQVRSTIDLFSTSAEPTLGDKFKSDEQPTIADKITKNPINELREAIGINEKFLFINELFNGDMGRYNKIIDELDQLQTMEGVNTYLLELKIQNQWSDNNPALLKLTELLHRKFIK